MKLPITTTHTSYVEFDTPCYYEDNYNNKIAIYDTGYIKVGRDSIISSSIETSFNKEFHIKEIRELLETGKPITEAEFKQAMEFTYTHLNILAS